MSNRTCTDFTKGGKCSNCGACCSDLLPISKDEVLHIKAYIKRHGIKEHRHNVMVGTDVTCPFRDEANRSCTIYPVRPTICRMFMCNRTEQDIQRTKWELMNKWQPVSMRQEFFGNGEVSDFFLYLESLVTTVRTGREQ